MTGGSIADGDRGAVLGVVVVTYASAAIITDCLASLAASRGVGLRVVVVDNHSPDATVETVRTWRGEHAAKSWLELIETGANGGFAHAVNIGLEHLARDPAIDLFWVLNPDCRVEPDTAARFAEAGADGGFSLLGGRVVFAERPGVVQTDGGRVSRWTGRCVSVNQDRPLAAAPAPAAATLDYISGASMVVSRRHLATAGPMREDYFLFYEEVDWALRRAPDLPLRIVPGAVVRHLGGTSTGSAKPGRGGSPLAVYFTYRGRMIFMRRFAPRRRPVALAYALAKAASVALAGRREEARAILAGTLGRSPPAPVRARLSAEALSRIAQG